MNLWIVPAANPAASQNVPRSLSKPISPEILKAFAIEGVDRAWGKRPGGDGIDLPTQMMTGDVCLFYTNEGGAGSYHWSGIVDRAFADPELAKAIWGDSDFSHIYLLREVWPIKLSTRDLSTWTDNYYKASHPMGMRLVNAQATTKMVKEFGNIEAWAKSLNGGPAIGSHLSPMDNSESEASTINKIENHINASGFHFSPRTIRSLYAATRAKPFVILAGNSGTGKSRLARLFAEACGATSANHGFTLIPVRPDWNDSSDLLGFRNLSGKYQPGRIVEPLLRAYADPSRPVFVCLDEMNLARVEYYFADFLSLIESRRKVGGKVITDTVITPKDVSALDINALAPELLAVVETLKTTGLCFPSNFIVIGTVNMDETTQPFSRKVLDRACTLEFNEIDLSQGFAPPAATPSDSVTTITASDLSAEFLTLADFLPAKQSEARTVANFLTTLNDQLSLGGLEVGYRVRDESAAYYVYARDAGMSEEEALHSIALQKVLPRVQGSAPRLEKTLAGLTAYFAKSKTPDPNADDLTERLAVLRRDATASPIVKKLAGMWHVFREEGFTSFWLA